MVVIQLLVPQNTTTIYLSQPIDPGVHHLMALSYNVNLQTWRNQYDSTTKTINPSTTYTSTALDISLHFLRGPRDRTTKVPRFPLHRVVNNFSARVTLNYNIVDDLAQSPYAMSALEFLRIFPPQRKALLSALGVVDPSDSRLITFNLDQGEPRIPSSDAFQVPVTK